MKVSELKLQTDSVQAVQITETNLKDVAFWCDGDVRGVQLEPADRVIQFYNAIDEVYAECPVGHWVVKLGPKYFMDMSPAAVKLLFREEV